MFGVKKDYPFGYVCPHCKEYAFYINHRPTIGEKIILTDFLCKDNHPEGFDDIYCQECHNEISNLSSNDVVEII